MRTMRSACTMTIALSLVGVAGAQILPPVPPAAPATPPYAPPPPPAPPPTPPPRPDSRPAEAEKPLPTLVERDASGKLRRYQTSLEEAALAKMEFDDEQRAKIDAVLAARRREAEALVVEKLDAVLEARRVGATISGMQDLNQMGSVKDAAAPVAQDRLVDRLLREGAITPLIRSRVEQVVKGYNDALMEERQEAVGADVVKIMQLVAGDYFTEATRDVQAALDRLLADAATRIETLGAAIGLSGNAQFEAVRSEVAKLSGDAAAQKVRREELTRKLFFDTLEADQRLALLRRVLEERK